jgi:DNA-binding NtrC family response regulator
MTPRPKISILLVDGDETLQGLRTLMLRLRGYRVEHVGSLEAGREAADRGEFQLVIVDVQQFHAKSLDFCEELKAAHPGLKVAFLANHTLYLPPQSCPDEVISRQDGPEQFLAQVDALAEASA